MINNIYALELSASYVEAHLPSTFYSLSIYNKNTNSFYIKMKSDGEEIEVEAGNSYILESVNHNLENYINQGILVKGTPGDFVMAECVLSNYQEGV